MENFRRDPKIPNAFPFIEIEGKLVIDQFMGVIWFNSNMGSCKLRICRIPKSFLKREMLDITLDPKILEDQFRNLPKEDFLGYDRPAILCYKCKITYIGEVCPTCEGENT